jgi:hypothetical protein
MAIQLPNRWPELKGRFPIRKRLFAAPTWQWALAPFLALFNVLEFVA